MQTYFKYIVIVRNTDIKHSNRSSKLTMWDDGNVFVGIDSTKKKILNLFN